MSDERDLTAEVPSWGPALERERIATHEAGHAAMLVRHGEVIHSLSIDELHDYGPHVQGNGSANRFLQRASILTAGCKAVTIMYPKRDWIFWTRGSALDDEHLSTTIEEFWAFHRNLGPSQVIRAIHDINAEARRIHRDADQFIVDPNLLGNSGLMMSPTHTAVRELSEFVAHSLALSILMHETMRNAVALVKRRLLNEGTIYDPIDLTEHLKALLANEV